MQFDSCGVLVVDEAAEVELLADLIVVADLFLQRAGVVGDRALQHGGQVEHQRDREQDRHDARDDADLALTAPEGADPLGNSLSGEREEQQRQRGADREGQRQRDGVRCRSCRWRRPATMAASTGPAHGTYSTPSARPSPKPLRPSRIASGGAGERLLEEFFELRKDQSEADRHQRDQREPADRVLRQV